MRAKSLLLVGCLWLAAPCTVAAQTSPADDEAIRVLYDKFFEAFRQAGAQGAIAYLRQSGSIEEDVLRQLERRARAAEQDPRMGRPDSYVVIQETQIAHALRFRTFYFLTHHDSSVIAWRLRFYKKVTGVWIFTDVRADSDFVEDFLRMSELEFAAYRRIVAGRVLVRQGEEDVIR